MDTSLTILAPTHNRPSVLSLVWPTWLAQDGIKEIVLVNDGSSIDYSNVLIEMSEACRINGVELKVIETKDRVGAPAAKNLGLKMCTSEEILTTDDDILLPNNMVNQCRLGRPKSADPIIVGPRVIYMDDLETQDEALRRSGLEKAPYFDFKKLTLCAWANPGKVKEYPFVTAVALWPASLFAEGLSFYEGYGGNGYREESDPQLRAAQQFGARVFLTPSSHCFHLPPGIAYAAKGGQRRGGILWFEYWVVKNNYIFLRRYSSYLKNRFGVGLVKAWIQLTFSRVSVNRISKALMKRV